MKLHKNNTRGFTLIELLVVIAIIAALAALAAPAILGAMKKAKIAKSRGVCTAFEVAVNNFESEYNYLPAATDTPDEADAIRSDNDLFDVLAGLEDTYNPKKIKFFTPGEATGNRDGLLITGTSATLYDPWGELYYITMDYDYDGEVEDPYDSAEVIRKKAICWSTGPDKDQGDIQLNRDNPSNF